MFRETKVISRAASNTNNKGKVETNPTYPRKANNKISLHDLNLINSKYLADVTTAGSEEEKELQQLSKMIRSHSFSNNDRNRKSPAESLLKRFIPKYKPNSIKLHKPSVVPTDSTGTKDKSRSPILQPLKQSQSASQSFSQSEPDNNNKSSTPSHPRSSLSSSCIKLPPTHNSSSRINSTNINSTNNTKGNKSTNKKPRKVRFQKKITIHYVPSDEERGSYEWRKNLTRQGIFEAMLWKSEIEKLELEEEQEEEALKERNNNNYYNNFPKKDTKSNYNNDINNSNILSVYGFK